jgi:HEAT repeat protein
MLTLAATAASIGFVAALSAQEDPNWIKIGETTAFGQTDPDARKLEPRIVPIYFPRQAIPPPDPNRPYLVFGDRRFELNEWGNIGRAYEGAGGFDDFKRRYDRAQARIRDGKAKVWRVRGQVFRRIDVERRSKDGVLESQRGYVNLQEIIFALQSFGRFEAMAEAFTEGAIDIQIVYGVEEEPVFGSYTEGEVWSFHPMDAGRDYLRGRINYGDYDSILYVYHPGRIDSYSFGGTIGRTNNATQAYVLISDGREQGERIGHAEAMLHEWYHQIETTYWTWGYAARPDAALPHLHAAEANGYTTDEIGYSGWFSWLRDLMSKSVRPGMWAKMSNREDPDWDAAIRQTKRTDGTLHRWANVEDSPWEKLPYLLAEDVGRRFGGEFRIESAASQLLFTATGGTARASSAARLDPADYRFNNLLNFQRESMARVGYGDRDLVFARFDVVDVVAHGLGANDANVLGYISLDSKFVVVFDVPAKPETSAEVNYIAVGPTGMRVSVECPGDVNRDKRPTVRVSSEAEGAQTMVADRSGAQIETSATGEFRAPSTALGTYVLRAIAKQGETTIERPFVVRTADPVRATLTAVGTRRVTGDSAGVKLALESDGEPRTVELVTSLPGEWKLEGLPNSVSLAARERKEITARLVTDKAWQDGPVTLAVDVRIAGYEGATPTERLVLTRHAKPTLDVAGFELTARPGAGTDGWNTKRPDNGGWTAKSVDGGVNGSALRVADSGGTRWGRVNAFGGYLESGKPDPDWQGYDVADFPYLDVHLKTEATSTLAYVVTLLDGRRFVAMIAGGYQEQWGESVQLARAKFIPNGQWQRVVYDLGAALKEKAGPGPHIVTDIGFGDSRRFCSNQTTDEIVHEYYLDDWRITREVGPSLSTTKEDPDAEIATPIDAKSEDDMARARFAASIGASATQEQLVALRLLLDDPSPIVRTTAAAAFTRVIDPGAIAQLEKVAKLDPEQRAGMYAMRALAKIDTPAAWAVIQAAIKMNRFEEHVQAEAGRLLAGRKQPGDMTAIGNLYTAQSWLVRQAAVEALGAYADDEASRRTLIFLLEVDPMVRLAVARLARPDAEPSERRLEWGSVNDFSSAVRGYCYAGLTRSGNPELRAKGYAGLADPDATIRTIILEEIATNPQAHHVEHVAPRLSDPHPDVRAAAVIALLKMPGNRTPSDFSALAEERYEQVLLPLLGAAKAGRDVLPQGLVGSLGGHRNSEVRKLAAELQGN